MTEHGKPDQDGDRSEAGTNATHRAAHARTSADHDARDDRPRPHRSEEHERDEARERGRIAREQRADGNEAERPADPALTACSPFAAVAESVRDYAIVLTDAEGVVSYWGEGARLMAWWTHDQAEGAHLRLLYPEGGSEDGTAEEHLRAAAGRGGYLGEGQRLRADGSAFWAGVTLTALRDEADALAGFAMVTRDLTARMAVETAVAGAGALRADLHAALERVRSAQAVGEAHREDAEFCLEQARSTRDYLQQVLEPELAALRIEHARPE